MTSNMKRCSRNYRTRALSIIHLEHRWRRFQPRTCRPCYPSRLVLYNHCWPRIFLSFYSISIDRILVNICFALYVKISFNKRIRPVNSVISMKRIWNMFHRLSPCWNEIRRGDVICVCGKADKRADMSQQRLSKNTLMSIWPMTFVKWFNAMPLFAASVKVSNQIRHGCPTDMDATERVPEVQRGSFGIFVRSKHTSLFADEKWRYVRSPVFHFLCKSVKSSWRIDRVLSFVKDRRVVWHDCSSGPHYATTLW